MRIVTTREMTALEAQMPDWGLPVFLLMEQAALQLAQVAMDILDEQQLQAVDVFCGWGNNGGDGYALARHLACRLGEQVVRVWEWEPERERSEDAKKNRLACEQMGLKLAAVEEYRPRVKCLLVDALFGTGLRVLPSPVPEKYQRLVTGFEAVQDAWQLALDHGGYLLAVDLLSGIQADTGALAYPLRVQANCTCALGYPKPGHYLRPGADCSGAIRVLPLSVNSGLGSATS